MNDHFIGLRSYLCAFSAFCFIKKKNVCFQLIRRYRKLLSFHTWCIIFFFFFFFWDCLEVHFFFFFFFFFFFWTVFRGTLFQFIEHLWRLGSAGFLFKFCIYIYIYRFFFTLSAPSRFLAKKKKKKEERKKVFRKFNTYFSFYVREMNLESIFLSQLIELFHRTMKKKKKKSS